MSDSEPCNVPFDRRYYKLLKILATRYHLSGEDGYFDSHSLLASIKYNKHDAYRMSLGRMRSLHLIVRETKIETITTDKGTRREYTEEKRQLMYRIEPLGLMYLEKYNNKYKRLFSWFVFS